MPRDLIVPSRRRFLLGAATLLAAPSIVRVTNLMPISTASQGFDIAEWLRQDIERSLARGRQHLIDSLVELDAYGSPFMTFLIDPRQAKDLLAPG